MNNGLSILKVVNGISKTLNIANQMIPLYKQVKPIIANSNKIVNGLKNLNINQSKSSNTNNRKNNYNTNNSLNEQSTNNYTPNTLTFFQ